MNYKLIIIIMIFAGFIVACKKRNYSHDTTKPVITVVEPLTNDTVQISVDPEVHIEFTATDNEALKTLNISVKDANGNQLFTESPNVAGNSVYPYHNHFIPANITSGQEITVSLKALDANENSVELVIPVYLKP